MPPGSADLGVFDLTFGVMRPTTFAPGGFAFVARFFAGFLTGFGFFFAHFVIGVFAFNDAAARCSFPASAFRAEVGTAEPPAARAAARFRRIRSRFALRCSSGSRYGTQPI